MTIKVRGENKTRRFPIMELFGPTIQGEGIMTGTLTHFLRTGGCGLRCEWCDSLHAVLPQEIKKGRQMLSVQDILGKVQMLPYAPYLTLTGGDPCLHDHLGDLIMPLNAMGVRVAVETQGQLFPEWLTSCDVLTFSPKGPSSGNVVDYEPLIKWLVKLGMRRRQRVCIKVVVFSPADFAYAQEVYSMLPEPYYDAFYFTAGTALTSPNGDPLPPFDKTIHLLTMQQALAEMMKDPMLWSQPANSKVHLGCQQHVLLWPDKDKGV